MEFREGIQGRAYLGLVGKFKVYMIKNNDEYSKPIFTLNDKI